MGAVLGVRMPVIQWGELGVTVVPCVLPLAASVAVRREMFLDSVKGPVGLTLPVVPTCEKRASAVRTVSADVTASPM